MANDVREELSQAIRPDWTKGPDGRSNVSEAFIELSEAVGRMIIDEARLIFMRGARESGGFIMAQLAHKYGLAPTKVEVRTAEEQEGRIRGTFEWRGKVYQFEATAVEPQP